jgi:asparagine synthase (glutamine-hydrolysing)
MCDHLAHRGPDDAGLWVDQAAGVALGHRRLAVVDLSPTGSQPMTSRDGRYVVTFNGELYNHRELRGDLLRHGVRLRGTSDTEVLVESVALRGLLETLRRANGMWALALWDRRERRLTLTRDRLGEKPLYVLRRGDTVAFASELGALRLLPECQAELDPEGLSLYLQLGWIPAPWTALRDVRKLPAGTLLQVGARGEQGPTPYWSLTDVAERGVADPLELDDVEVVDAAEELLLDSVRLRAAADVPVGAFLSGGVDSSTVVSLLAASGTVPSTYTVAVGDEGDESAHAAQVARHLGTRHTEIRLDVGEALDAARAAPQAYDEPFADPSAIPTLLMCREARREVTVCLSGDGGDELLAGYNRYLVAGRLGSLLRLPGPARRAGSRALQTVRPGHWDQLGDLVARATGRQPFPGLGVKAHKLAGLLGASDTLGAFRSLTTVWEPQSLLGPSAPGLSAVGLESNRSTSGSSLAPLLLADQTTTLPDDMLVKVDRASMAVSLEARVPLLDHRFVEMSWRLPHRAKVRDGRGKWLLRQVLARHVPPAVTDRPKIGFDPPLGSWLRGPLRDWARDLLSADRLAPLGIDPAPVAAALDEHERGRFQHDYRLWTLLALQAWWEAPVGVKAA